MQGRIEMSRKEIVRLEVLRRVSDSIVSKVMTAQTLGVSVRRVRR